MKNKKTEDEYKEAAQNSLSVDDMCRHLKIKPHIRVDNHYMMKEFKKE